VRCGRETGQGESIGFEFARVGEREDKEGVRGYEACEVKKTEKNYAVLYFAAKRILLYIFMKPVLGNFFKNGPLFTTYFYNCS
jgi:hypothetical protein